MTHAYKEFFLDDAMETLGSAMEYAVLSLNIEGQEFLDLFLAKEGGEAGDQKWLVEGALDGPEVVVGDIEEVLLVVSAECRFKSLLCCIAQLGHTSTS